MSRVIHFELAVDDPARARAFYEQTLGWKITQWGDQEYWMVTTGEAGTPGIDGALTTRRENWPALVNIIDVASLDETVAAVKANGGRVVEGPMPIPGVGYLAYCLDTEGNAFGLMQDDPNAASA
jgi:predicted enzyme related to lactoylglutathione lyase